MADIDKISLTDIFNEPDISKKINALAVIAYDNRLTLISHTAALIKLEEQCTRGYNKREKSINWGSAIGAAIATGVAVYAAIAASLSAAH